MQTQNPNANETHPQATGSQASASQASSKDTVTVGCKLPHGLKMELFNEAGIAVQSFTVKGMNDARIIGGYGITEGVPKDFIEEWFKRNPSHSAITSGLIFTESNHSRARAHAKELRDQKTGLEAIDPLKDGRKHGLIMDKESEQAYRQQMADNPVRNRQVVE